MRVLAKMLGAHKGDKVCWYETPPEASYNKRSWEKKNTYSIKPDNLNVEKYKRLLLSKLNDILEITGFDGWFKIAIIEP